MKALKLGKSKEQNCNSCDQTGGERKRQTENKRPYKTSDFIQGRSTNLANIKHSGNGSYRCCVTVSIIPNSFRDFRLTSDLTKPIFQSSGSKKA